MARHHAVPNDAALDRLIIRLMMMKVPKAGFFGNTCKLQEYLVITVAFCQAFLWMIVMTFYHTGMPTVAQARYFDTLLRSLTYLLSLS